MLFSTKFANLWTNFNKEGKEKESKGKQISYKYFNTAHFS